MNYKEYTVYSISLNLFALSLSILITLGFLKAYMLTFEWLPLVLAVGGIIFSFMMLGDSDAAIRNVQDSYSRHLQRENERREKLNAMSDQEFIRRETKYDLFMGLIAVTGFTLSGLSFLNVFDLWGFELSMFVLGASSIILIIVSYSWFRRDNWRVCVEGGEKHLHVTDRSYNRCKVKAGKYCAVLNEWKGQIKNVEA